MKGKLILIMTLALLNIGCYSSNFTLSNKYLVYSHDYKSEDNFWAPFFYYRSSDTVYKVEGMFGNREEVAIFDDSNNFHKQLVAAPANIQYTVSKRKHNVYFVYNDKGRFDTVRVYSLIPGDTNRIEVIRRNGISGYNETVYTGRDTVFYFYGNKIKCREFIEIPLISPFNKITNYYLDMETFLPVIVDEHYYKNRFSELIDRRRYVLRYTLDKNEVQSEEMSKGF